MHRKALLSEEELLVTKERDKVCKASKRVSETCEQTLHRQEQNQTHLACAEGSTLQCCSYFLQQLIGNHHWDGDNIYASLNILQLRNTHTLSRDLSLYLLCYYTHYSFFKEAMMEPFHYIGI